MKFGEVPVADALGTILAHGVPSAGLSKGVTLGQGHITALKALGTTSVMVARLEQFDIDENTAADKLAKMVVPDVSTQGLRVTKSKTGRVNIIAQRAGVLRLDVERITALNGVDPMITIATLPDLKRVTAGVMIATIKVISYAVPEDTLRAAAAAFGSVFTGGWREDFAMFVRPAKLTTATLIETHHPGSRPRPKGRRVLDERLDRLGCTLMQTLNVPHEEGAIANALAHAEGQVVFLLTASATSDAHDTAPTALRRAGGRVIHYGMPVDPGNLLFLGEMGKKSVIGLPGCARSPALNGADWVMERIICGLPMDGDVISAMGVGGLLKDIPERGRARGDG